MGSTTALRRRSCLKVGSVSAMLTRGGIVCQLRKKRRRRKRRRRGRRRRRRRKRQA